jgi:hypothetical protein
LSNLWRVLSNNRNSIECCERFLPAVDIDTISSRNAVVHSATPVAFVDIMYTDDGLLIPTITVLSCFWQMDVLAVLPANLRHTFASVEHFLVFLDRQPPTR